MKAMKYAKKMKLVPVDDISHSAVDQSHLPDENFTASRILSILDDSMNAILNRNDINDGEKWTLYNQTLQRYLNHMKKTHSQNSNVQRPQKFQSEETYNRHHTPSAFNNSISEHDISGIFPMKPSIESALQPNVREFFEQARKSDASQFSPISATSIYDEINSSNTNADQSPHRTPLQITHQPMSISIPSTDETRNIAVRKRGPKRNAVRDMTTVHPYKMAKDHAAMPKNLEPTQLYRNRRQPQSNMEFYWQPTNAK